MRLFRLPSLLAGIAAAGIMAFASPAWANMTININPGNVPTTAVGHSDHECAGVPGGPYADKDVWVFNLAGNHGTTGDFVTVTAQFSTPDGPKTFIIPTDGGAIYLSGHSKAYIALPAGYTLTGASAEITGTASQFVLTHTCPAGGSQSPSPDPSPSPSSSTPGDPGGSPSNSTPGTPGLPTTGAAVGTIAVSGVTIIAVGAVVLFLLNRRRKLELARLSELE